MRNLKKIIEHINNRVLIRKVAKYFIAILYKIYNSNFLKVIFNIISKKRRKIKQFEQRLKLIDNKFFKIANYYLPISNSLNVDSNFLSFGVGADVEFEFLVFKKYNISSFCFDPTPRSQQFIEALSENFISYFPIGLSENGGNLTFYQTKPYSDYTLIKPKIFWDKFEATCLSIDEILNKLEVDYIDLIKLDIEGSAMESISHLCSKPNRFGILIAELELMDGDIKKFIKEVNQILNLVNNNGYTIYRLPKENSNYKSIEIIILNKDTENLKDK